MTSIAQLFKVLSDDVRLKMIWLLLNHEELCVCDFIAALEITQSKASRHLRTLWHGGLVNDRKEGLWSYYSLRPLEAERTGPHLELLRTTLAKCSEASAALERLNVWLANNRTLPLPPAEARTARCASSCTTTAAAIRFHGAAQASKRRR